MICVKAGSGGGSGTNMDDATSKLNRRDLFRMIGLVAGGSVMYQAMTSLGYAADSQYAGPIKLQGAPRGAKVIVLGAGLAGLVSADQVKGLRSMAH
jgi:monoamine oxidase